jgi:hypothetical protein
LAWAKHNIQLRQSQFSDLDFANGFEKRRVLYSHDVQFAPRYGRISYEFVVKYAHVIFAVSVAMAGCSKSTSQGPPVSAPNISSASAGANGAADETAKTVARLTQALRKYSAEHQRVPKSLNELVAEGYLSEMPAAPPGKAFTFDEQLRVTVTDRK